MEAITSRPLLPAAVGKAASHAGPTTLCLTPIWQGGHDQIADRQYSRGHTACQAHCGAVQDERPMGRADALRERADCANTRAVQAPRRPAGSGVTEYEGTSHFRATAQIAKIGVLESQSLTPQWKENSHAQHSTSRRRFGQDGHSGPSGRSGRGKAVINHCSTRAAPSSMATCPSCPQACITPGTCER